MDGLFAPSLWSCSTQRRLTGLFPAVVGSQRSANGDACCLVNTERDHRATPAPAMADQRYDAFDSSDSSASAVGAVDPPSADSSFGISSIGTASTDGGSDGVPGAGAGAGAGSGVGGGRSSLDVTHISTRSNHSVVRITEALIRQGTTAAPLPAPGLPSAPALVTFGIDARATATPEHRGPLSELKSLNLHLHAHNLGKIRLVAMVAGRLTVWLVSHAAWRVVAGKSRAWMAFLDCGSSI